MPTGRHHNARSSQASGAGPAGSGDVSAARRWRHQRSTTTARAAIVAGVGAWVPPWTVTNDALLARLGLEPGWIERRSGIGQRHVVSPGMATSDLAVEAGARALESADGLDVDAVVVATTSPDRLCPSTAPEVASRLGLAGVPAYDLAAACSGFIYGLASCAGLISAGIAERILLIGAEAFTSLVDPNDRDTAVLFGDGAGAVVLRAGDPGEPGAVGPWDLGSDGEHSDLLAVAAGASRQRSARSVGQGAPPPQDQYLSMAGAQVYRHAVARMTASAQAVLDRAGWPAATVDHLIAHQCNARILRVVAGKVGISDDRLVIHLDRVGNTLAASIPLALADAAWRGVLHSGSRVLLTAFGAGLTWGSTVLVWPELPSHTAVRDPTAAPIWREEKATLH
ncbi:beta-ketoacyl-ACP synthase III [Streptomyces sp. 7N604]|uniref:beta-ketoacyl-ACP synthase III n=1 Tax=Streptomyces sp. 7N604 TaxID=3457415 RepID=UPI003FD6B0BE